MFMNLNKRIMCHNTFLNFLLWHFGNFSESFGYRNDAFANVDAVDDR